VIPLPYRSQSHCWHLHICLVHHIYLHWLLGLLLRSGVVHRWWHVEVHDHVFVPLGVHDWKLKRNANSHGRTVKLIALSTKVELIKFFSLVKYR
jgi:hypothetical protein